jgi:hypothetical protein
MDNPVFDFWNKLMVNMWAKMAEPAGDPFTWFTQPDRGKDLWQIPLKMTQAMADSFASLTGVRKQGGGESDSLSDLVSNLMQTGFEGYLKLQKKWLDNVRKGGSPLHEIDSLSQTPLIWLESFRKLPDLMPSGGASDSSRDLLDKCTAFSAKMSELVYQLYLPMDKAWKAWAENMDKMQGEGKAPQNAEEATRVWFTVLESSYLDLFKSPGYTKLLHETADAYEGYSEVRRQVYGPFPKAAEKPQEGKTDALSEEVSKLREKLEELLQKMNSQAGAPPKE